MDGMQSIKAEYFKEDIIGEYVYNWIVAWSLGN
jgi:hypothetical protein